MIAMGPYISRYLTTILCLIWATIASGQINRDEFKEFATRQDALMVDAYERKDSEDYERLLKDFLYQYESLSDSDKKFFSEYLNGAYYNLACTYSLLGNKPLAIEYLKKSIDAGFADYYHIQQDSDLDNLRDDEQFKTIGYELRKVGDYLFILKNGAKYNRADNQPIPAFTYQSSKNENLTELRRAFNLDSIAGNGNDVLSILNLLHWVHNLVLHDGSHENPTIKNAMSMIEQCRQQNRGLNCRGMATVLNECYLSMGIPSRIVTCLPKDSLKIDNDCHVINMVYSETLNKWVWIDPTFNAYVMNEKGELLSIEEVRERIINDQPVILNPDANWNNQNTQTKAYYLLTYMAKNLYILESPLSSEYDMETKGDEKQHRYVQLVPLDHFEQTPRVLKKVDETSRNTWITYRTNNPDLFWKHPTE